MRVVETFEGMTFLNHVELINEDGEFRFIRSFVPYRPISVFLLGFGIGFPTVLGLVAEWDLQTHLAITFCVVIGTTLFSCVFWGIGRSQEKTPLPTIDETSLNLHLASGTTITRQRIRSFVQYHLAHLNFKLVLITVRCTDECEYALLAAVETCSSVLVGNELSSIYGVELETIDASKYSSDEREQLGVGVLKGTLKILTRVPRNTPSANEVGSTNRVSGSHLPTTGSARP